MLVYIAHPHVHNSDHLAGSPRRWHEKIEEI